MPSETTGASGDDFDISDALDEAHFEAAAHMDPSIRKQRTLVIRLQGPNLNKGRLDTRLAAEIVSPVGDEVRSADESGSVSLDFTGVSEGSVVLHFNVHGGYPRSDPGALPLEPDSADLAIRRVLTLHDLLEASAPAGQIANQFSSPPRLLRATARLVARLNEHDLDFSAKWRTDGRTVARSKLSERGRLYAVGVFDRIEHKATRTITGQITAVDLDGVFIVTTQQGRQTVSTTPALISSGSLRLGDEITARVEVRRPEDQVGLHGHERLRLLEVIGGPATLPLGDDMRTAASKEGFEVLERGQLASPEVEAQTPTGGDAD